MSGSSDRLREAVADMYWDYMDIRNADENAELSVADYLLLRKQALDEMARESAAAKPARQAARKPRAQASAIKAAAAPPEPAPAIIRKPEPEAVPDDFTGQEEEQDEYALLRSLPDPWN